MGRTASPGTWRSGQGVAHIKGPGLTVGQLRRPSLWIKLNFVQFRKVLVGRNVDGSLQRIDETAICQSRNTAAAKQRNVITSR